MAEAVYRQDAMQLQDLCGFTRIRDQGAVPRKVKVNEECRPAQSTGDGGGCYDLSSGRDDALGVCLVVDTDLAFVAMCLAAACGQHEVVEIIGNAGQWQCGQRRTLHAGRGRWGVRTPPSADVWSLSLIHI